MFLKELFINKKNKLSEGGNVSSQSPGWQGLPDEQADEIDLKLHDRDFMVSQLKQLLLAQNESFKQSYGRYIWDPKLLDSGQMFSGSSLHFFDLKKITTKDFLEKLKKTKVGDLDTQVDQEIGDEITAWLKSIIGKKVGNGTFVGFNSSLSSIWKLDDPPVRVQVDYELGPYDPAQGKEPARPTEWFAYSHSSDLADLEQGIKGVFHKYINRAMTYVNTSEKYVARVLKKSVKISPEPVVDNDYSFAVKGPTGGGMSNKYKPYIDPATGDPMYKDGIPVMQLLEPKDRDYIQNLDKQFEINFGRKRTAKDKKLQNSFVGTLKLMNSSFTPEENEGAARAFLDILFAPGAQMINVDDPERDRDVKFAAVDAMLLGGKDITPLNLPDNEGLRQEAVQMAINYADTYRAKKANQPAPVTEEVAASPRQGIDHLSKMNDIQFIEFAKSIQRDLNGKIDAIPVTLKVDGLGARFGKGPDGTPFFESSSSGPIFKSGSFSAFAQKQGHDELRLQRAKHYDELFDLITNSQFVKKLPNDTKVFCEIMYNPMATATESGLKFVAMNYDKKLLGNKLSIVPHYVEKTDNTPHPQSEKIKEWLLTQSSPDIKFIDDRLNYEESLDVSATIDPVLSLNDQAIAVLQSRKMADKDEKAKIKASIQAVKNELANQILNNPKLVDKYKLGQDIEGIVLHRPNAPKLKITTTDFQQSKSGEKTVKEDTSNGVAIIFGRFNPPHKGHKEAWRAASKHQDWLVGTHQETEGPDDPLPFDIKIEAMKAVAAAAPAIPDFENHLLGTNSWRHLARQMYLRQLEKENKSEGEKVSVSLFVCTDEKDKDSYLRMVASGNGTPNKMGNVPYNFMSVEWQPTPRLSSATDLRNAVKNGDRQGFTNAAGMPADAPVAGMKFFDLVSKYLMPYKEKQDEKKRLKREKEAEKMAKLAKKKPVQPNLANQLSESYEQIMSTLIERIIENEFRRPKKISRR